MKMKYQTAAASDKARYDKKIHSLQNRLEGTMQSLDKEKLLWEAKLAQANTELDEAKDEVYVQKYRHRKLVQQHLNEVNKNEQILKNYNDSLHIDIIKNCVRC